MSRNDANFAINRSDVFTFGGLISGAGRFEQAGSGTTIFTANNTYTGNTVISGGTLQLGDGGTTGAIASSLVTNLGILAFNRSNTYDFGAVISGTGAVQQNGTGTTIFGATHSYTGATTVNAGTLIVNGSIATSSGVTVNAGGTLGGTGTLPKTTINGGTLSPGNSIGTISVNGSLSFVGPGNYIVEVSPSAADKTNVTGAPGTATLAGTLSAVGLGGIYTVGTKYTVLNATGGVSGTFSNLAITRQLRHHQAAHRIRRQQRLSGARSRTRSRRSSSAPRATSARSRARSTPRSRRAARRAPFLALFNLTAAQLPGALDQLSRRGASPRPRAHCSTRASIRARPCSGGCGRRPMAATRRWPRSRPAGRRPSRAERNLARSPMASRRSSPRRRRWSRSRATTWCSGRRGSARAASSTPTAMPPTVRRDLAGFFSGADMRVGTSGRVGIAAGYTGSKYALDGRGGSTVETGHLMGYGGWSFGALNLRAGGAYAWHTIDTSRTVNVPGLLRQPDRAL